MRDLLSKIIVVLFTTALSFLAGIAGYKYTQGDKYTNRKFDLLVIPKHEDYAELEENKVQITYGGKPIHGYNDVTIKLYNFQDMWFQDVPVYLEVTPESGDSIKMIGVKLNDKKQSIQEISGFPKIENGAIKLGYKIHSANYTHIYGGPPILDVTLEAISSKPLHVEATVDYSGIDEKPEAFPEGLNKYTTSFLDTGLGAIVVILSFAFGVYLIIALIARVVNVLSREKLTRKRQLKYQNLLDKVKEEIKAGKIASDDPEKVIECYLKTHYKDEYEKTWSIIRWISDMRKPEK